MSARKRRSRKQSAANSRPPPEFTYFIDRNLGKHKVAEAIRAAGEQVEVHDDHLPQNAPDEDWIQLVGEKGWLAVTKDKNIRYRQSEIAAIRAHAARIFVISPKNVTADDISEILLKASARMKKFAEKTQPPFVAAVYRDGAVKPYPV